MAKPAKKLLATSELLDYVRGVDSIPSKKDLEKYQALLLKKMKKKYPSGYVRLYRGFSSPKDRESLGQIFAYPDALVSFTTSRQTAMKIAEERALDQNEYGYAIRIDVPIKQVYFHYTFDEIGNEHPNEKEVIIDPYGYDWDVIHYVKSHFQRK